MIRVGLVLATAELIDADLAGPERLGSAIGGEVAKDWPPEHHHEGALGWMRTLAEDPGSRGWGMYYITVPEGERSLVVGTCGFHGPPEDSSSAGRGDGGSARSGRTRCRTCASIGVLEKLGFVPAEPSRPGVVSFELLKT